MSLQLWTEAGVANGLATLGADSRLTPAQLALVAADMPTGVATWSKYVVTMVAGNLLVNGSIVAAKAAATTQSLALFTKAASTVVEKVVIKHSTAFAGTLISAVTASVGVVGGLTDETATLDVFQAVGNLAFKESDGVMESFAAIGMVLSLVSTGANLSALSAGALTVWVKSSVLP